MLGGGLDSSGLLGLGFCGCLVFWWFLVCLVCCGFAMVAGFFGGLILCGLV